MKPTKASTLAAIERRLAERAGDVDVLGIGEACLDEVWLLDAEWRRGAKTRAARREQLGGGQVATALVACARLGRRAAFAGAVGSDAAGAEVLDGLRAEGVDVSRARQVTGDTRATAILVEPGGERTIIERVDPRVAPHVDAALFDRARLLHLDASQVAVSLHAARLARERGVVVSLDADSPHPGLDELLALADLCIVSAALTGERELPRALGALAARTDGVVICTLGPLGAAAYDREGDRLILSPAFPVEVVDTTACGDVFHAAAICALFDGQPLPALLRFANAAAALKCRDLGRRGCPTRGEVDALLARE